MSIVRIAVPLLKGKRRFHLDKGRPWSVVEHAILAAIATRPRMVRELAELADLPRRLVLEILIRLMRAGWVILSQSSSGVLFGASPAGMSVVDYDELPNVSKRMTRWMTFVIDRITGTLYRGRDFAFYTKHVLQRRAEVEHFVWMEPRDFVSHDEPAALVSTLLDDDEKFIACDPTGEKLVDRYALLTVHNGQIDGIPPYAPRELIDLVLQAAQSAPSQVAGASSPSFKAPARQAGQYEYEEQPEEFPAVFSPDDLILGAREHKDVLTNAIINARHRLIIHSTFISEDKFLDLRPLLLDAVARGVQIDVLWGEDDEKIGRRSTQAVVRRLRAGIESTGFDSSLKVHPFSTRSHAKFVVADNGNSTQFHAVVGSCNWLSTGFQSFEASVRLRDPKVVATLLDNVAELTRGADGHWTDLTNDVARLASEVRRCDRPKSSVAQMAILLGPQHGQYVRRARDMASTRLFVTSHRLGAATRPAVVVPAIAAAEARGVNATIYFGTSTDGIAIEQAPQLASALASHGIRLRPVSEPRLHAKILAWDDDFVVLTSQNWLSADPSEANMRREIGVYVNAKNVGHRVIERFELMRQG